MRREMSVLRYHYLANEDVYTKPLLKIPRKISTCTQLVGYVNGVVFSMNICRKYEKYEKQTALADSVFLTF